MKEPFWLSFLRHEVLTLRELSVLGLGIDLKYSEEH